MPWIYDAGAGEGGSYVWAPDSAVGGEGGATVTYGNNPADMLGTQQEGGFVSDAVWEAQAAPETAFQGLIDPSFEHSKAYSPYELLARGLYNTAGSQVQDAALNKLLYQDGIDPSQSPQQFVEQYIQNGGDPNAAWSLMRNMAGQGASYLPTNWADASAMGSISLPH
ncbi:MAG TPA: hypothetical protein VGD26_06525, partial [Chitinophagaceae bacterium]